MAKKVKKQTANQLAYAKQVKRIKQFIRRAEKRGYVFKENILPKQPKRITKQAIVRLEKLTGNKLYENSRYGGSASYGEIVKGSEGRKLERQEAARKSAETRKYKLQKPKQETTNTKGFEPPENISEDTFFYDAVVISGFRTHIRRFNETVVDVIFTWLNDLISKWGEHAVAVMLDNGARDGLIVTYQVAYSSDKLVEYMGKMLDYLPGINAEYARDITEALEYEEDFELPI